MKQFKNIILALLVSPELVAIIGVLVLLDFCPSVLSKIGFVINNDNEVGIYLLVFVIGLVGVALKLSSKLRAPLDSSSNKDLYNWPLYPLLVARVMVGVFYSLSSGVISIALLMGRSSIEDKYAGGLFMASILVVAITSFTMLLAHQKIRELIEKYSE